MREITSAENEKLKQFTRVCREKKLRDEMGVCVLDGAKLCADAHAGGLRVLQLWLSEDAAERYGEQLQGVAAAADEVFVLRAKAAAKLSELKAPQGVFALVQRPQAVSVKALCANSRILGLCSLQNPENVGAAIRTAAALGFGGVLLSADCADAWSPRALRAGAGCQLQVDMAVADDYAAAVASLREAGVYTMASALHRDAVQLGSVQRRPQMFIAVGNEGRGLPQDVIDACDDAVVIPMSERAESLNAAAAAAILLWELRA
ncbi:MAG: RNA methyltransferase [Oscillospiraceae bacterium]|nr:RNA methyltransferase [Oscillospiraceae bacterium]